MRVDTSPADVSHHFDHSGETAVDVFNELSCHIICGLLQHLECLATSVSFNQIFILHFCFVILRMTTNTAV